MKKTLLTVIFSAFCLCSWAQGISLFTCDSEKECVKVADSLLCDSERTYKLTESTERKSDGYRFYQLIYREVCDGSSEPLVITINFKISMIGANPSMEIEGTPSYKLYSVYGKYLDIFPIWKKYIDPTADIEFVSKNGTKNKRFEPLAFYRLSADDTNKGYWALKGTFAK